MHAHIHTHTHTRDICQILTHNVHECIPHPTHTCTKILVCVCECVLCVCPKCQRTHTPPHPHICTNISLYVRAFVLCVLTIPSNINQPHICTKTSVCVCAFVLRARRHRCVCVHLYCVCAHNVNECMSPPTHKFERKHRCVYVHLYDVCAHNVNEYIPLSKIVSCKYLVCFFSRVHCGHTHNTSAHTHTDIWENRWYHHWHLEDIFLQICT